MKLHVLDSPGAGRVLIKERGGSRALLGFGVFARICDGELWEAMSLERGTITWTGGLERDQGYQILHPREVLCLVERELHKPKNFERSNSD